MNTSRMNPIKCLPHFQPLWQAFRYKVLFSGRGSGKSAHLAIFLIWLASRAKIKILCLREFQVSIEESMKAEIEKWIELSGTRKDWICSLRYIKHKYTGSKFIFRGIRNNPKSIKSMTDIGCAVFEECEDATKESIDLLIPTLRLPGSFFIFAGNPKGRSCAVAQMFIENEPPPGTVVINNSYLDNPFCSPELIAEAEHLKATNPALYAHVWLGAYLETENLKMVPEILTGTPLIPPSAKTVIGCDTARTGGDRTCICVRRGTKVVELLEYPSMDKDLLVHTLTNLHLRYKPERINVDTTGHGSWCGDMLRNAGIKGVHDINFSSSATKDKDFSNKRTEMYSLPSEFFRRGGRIDANALTLIQELEASTYTLDLKNRMKRVPKDEIRKLLGGRSPDVADAFCLSLICDGDMIIDTRRIDNINRMHAANSLIEAGSWGG